MYDIKDVAEIVLSYGPMTHKKLQKLCYYVYAWYFVVFGEKLSNAHFEAWVHGPVSPQLYKYYKMYGWNNIRQSENSDKIGRKNLRFIESIINIYGHYDADTLEVKTHEEEPWINARIGVSKYASSDNIISDSDILKYYPMKEKEIYTNLVDDFIYN